MTIKQFIEKAIEGGWTVKGVRSEDLYEWADGFFQGYVLLDPLAWQAVGKVHDFDFHDSDCDLMKDYCNHPDTKCECEKCDCSVLTAWKDKMHQMIDALAEGKSISEFIETL